MSTAINCPYTQVDGFCFLPDARRIEALKVNYGVEKATGLEFPGIAVVPKVSQLDLKRFPGPKPKSVDTFFRLNVPSMAQPTDIHTDNAMATRTAVLYLSHKNIGGTAFWKHKESGLTRAPTQADLQVLGGDYMNKLREDGIHRERWEQVALAEAAFNRLVVFDSALWHSSFPGSGWGTNAKDGRLIQVFFIHD